MSFRPTYEKGSFLQATKAYKAGCEIFVNNFLTGNSQNNRQKYSGLGGTKLKSGWGERKELSFFSSLRGSERAAEFSAW